MTLRASSLLSRERGVASLPARRPESVPESSRFRRTTFPGTASRPPTGASSRLRPDAAGAAWPAGRGGESGVGNPAPLQTPAPPGPCPTAPLVPPRLLLPFLPFPTLYPFSPPPSPLSVPGTQLHASWSPGRAPPAKPVTRAFPAQRLQMRESPS